MAIPHTPGRTVATRAWRVAFLFALPLASSCGSLGQLPPPHAIVYPTGARLTAEAQRLGELNDWLYALLETISCQREVTVMGPRRRPLTGPPGQGPNRPEDEMRRERRTLYCMFPGAVITNDPSGGFTDFRRGVQDPRINLRVLRGDEDTYPWETLVIQGDTARIRVPGPYFDAARTAYTVYAYLHLAHHQGRLERWLPGSAELEGFALERAIVERVAEVWLMGRTLMLADPYPAMDELLLAREQGQVEPFLLTLRPDEFRVARAAWLKEHPGGMEAYRTWFRTALDREPPAPRTARNPSR